VYALRHAIDEIKFSNNHLLEHNFQKWVPDAGFHRPRR
jgi:hypothetical protein